MEHIDYLKGLSSGDPQTQLASIPRIIHYVKQNPSPILVNTLAINMAVEFTRASNRLRYFIFEFFKQCRTEMCMIKSKKEVFMHLTSVLDRNDPVAQCLLLKILESLSALLTDLLEVHHKILLALKSPHKKVSDTAAGILPKVLSFAPGMAKHVFQEGLSKEHFWKLIKVIPESQEAIKSVYAFLCKNLEEEEVPEALTLLALKNQSVVSYVKEVLVSKGKTELLQKLCEKYGSSFLSQEELSLVEFSPESTQTELLCTNKLTQADYKSIYLSWNEQKDPSLVIQRLKSLVEQSSPETHLCFKLAIKLNLGCTDLLLQVLPETFKYEACLLCINSNHPALDSLLWKLNNYELYKVACYLLRKAEYQKALELLVKLKTEYRGSSEKVYEWLCTLISIAQFESTKEGFEALTHLECLGSGPKTYFHNQFVTARILLVHCLKQIKAHQEPKNYSKDFLTAKKKFHKLLFLFPKIDKVTTHTLKKWREVSGILGVFCESNSKEVVQEYYPKSYALVSGSSSIEAATTTLETPLHLPPQIFKFNTPFHVTLEIWHDSPLKVIKGKEFILEFTAQLHQLSHKPPQLEFSGKALHRSKVCKQVFKVKRQAPPSGVCNMSIPVYFFESGPVTLTIKAQIISNRGRKIGKCEYGELSIECL